MADRRALPVPDGLDGLRLDAAVARLFGLSRTLAATLVEDGSVTLDGDTPSKSTRVPGGAWLELSVTPTDTGSHYRQRAVFLPRGLAGHAYWASVLPFHGIVFSGMARNIARGAEQPRSAPAPSA